MVASTQPTPEIVWATPFNLQWARSFENHDVCRHVFSIGDASVGSTVYICAEKFRYMGELVACTLRSGAGDLLVLTISLPLVHMTMLDLIAAYHARIGELAGGTIDLVKCPLKWSLETIRQATLDVSVKTTCATLQERT